MSQNNYHGLSLSERLNNAGIAEQFSQAVKTSDSTTMTTLLLQIDYSPASAKATVDTFLENPNAFQN